MECMIKSKKENKVIGRTEVSAEIAYTGATPSNDVVKKELAQAMKSDESLVVIKHIHGIFGEQKAKVDALAYHDKKTFDLFQIIKKKPKKAAPEAKAEAKAPKPK